MPDHSVAVDAIPKTLRSLDQWVVWRYEKRAKNRTKVPYNARTEKRASVTSASSWSSLDDALAASHKFDGIGFVVTATDPVVGIDLDGCICQGEVHPQADALIKRFSSYTEVSPSGQGIRIFVIGNLEGGRTKKDGVSWEGFAERAAEIAVYGDKRFFTITGDAKFTDGIIEDRQRVLDAVLSEFFSSDEGGPVDFAAVLEEITTGADAPTERIEHLCAVDPEFNDWWEKDVEDGSVDGSQRDYRLAYRALLNDMPIPTVAAILESARDDDAHGRHDNEGRLRTYLARTIARAQHYAVKGKRFRVLLGKKGVTDLPDIPKVDDVVAQCEWLTSVLNLDPEHPVKNAEWQGLRGPKGHVVLNRVDAQQIRFEPATQILTPAKLTESLAFQREHSDGAMYTYMTVHARAIADVIRLLCDTSQAISEEEQFAAIVSTLTQMAEPVFGHTTYGTVAQRFEAVQMLRGAYNREGHYYTFEGDKKRYLVDERTGELVFTAHDLNDAARKYTGIANKHGWVQALAENAGWTRTQVQGYPSQGREGRKEGHIAISIYRGHPK